MPESLRRAVFLDRDGVINRTYLRDGVSIPPATVEQFEFLPGVIESARRLSASGFVLVVVTNQPDVARGRTTRDNVERLNDIVRQSLPVVEVLTCYHDRGDNCPCRKPKPGMLLESAARHEIDLGRSFMVGDRPSDIEAGQAAGCRTVLVVTPHGGSERCSPDHSVADLAAAAEWILLQTPETR
jgi:D-glycero-D-manno-heptose 1,7-bisphosphate phosphatase